MAISALVGGVLRFAGVEFIPSSLIILGFGVPVLLWLPGLGWFMLRRASDVAVGTDGSRQGAAPAG